MNIDKNSKITLNFELSTSDDLNLIDSNFDSDPVTFTYADGNLLPGFEEKLLGLKAGSEESFVVKAEQAFGEVRADNQHWFPLSKFKDLELDIGLMIDFSGNEQAQVTGIVSEIDESRALIDFNHPLAGRDILFKVKILNVQQSDNIFVQQEPLS